LFKAGFKMDTSKEGIIWVSQVKKPEQFGVVKLTNTGAIEGFYEKPKAFVSDLAIIGIYYFREGEYLQNELQYLLDQRITTGGEYGITDGLQNMMKKGTAFHTETVQQWHDCGNKDALVRTNKQVLQNLMEENLISNQTDIEESIIIHPCYIAKGVKISKSVVGPYVSIGTNSVISNAIVRNSIIQHETSIKNKLIEDSMIGPLVTINGKFESYSLGAYNQLNE
jgi:glucose-1-phosphate thymidylyltransferase